MLELHKAAQKQEIQQDLLYLIHHLHAADSSSEFLSLDSLAKIELLTAIEKKFAVCLEEHEIAEANTLDDLTEIILAKKKQCKRLGSLLMKQTTNTSISFKKSLLRSIIHRFIREWAHSRFGIEVIESPCLPSEGPFILAANHSSHLDNLALMMGGSFDNYVLLAAKDYFYEPRSVRLFLLKKLFNLLPFERSSVPSAMWNNINRCKAVIKANKNLIIFPEATRSLNGEIQAFKGGCAMLAWELQVPIVPAYIHGTYNCLPKGTNWPKKGKIIVSFGTPIVTKNYVPNGTELHYQYYKMITQELEQQIKQLRDDLYVKEHL
ncbi:1-acyl-sn-glycerol-3-phosphate acyltransferase [Legionella lytica]|uniref:1-acyl-sn-glycerol-3-phosphate acyltransferase n=1 Tax=Legionella lytica TaxID=96232 RepID=A0ABW8DCK6_9GAMM